MKNLGHLMLDLETMGNKSNAVIVSIGAVEFDIETGELGKEFYERIDLQSCLDVGLIVNGSTLYWWLQQSEAARNEICKKGNDLRSALVLFNTFMIFENDFKDIQIWGNGARFDIGILEDAYTALKLGTPWNFRNERDVRTLVSFAPQVKEHYPISGMVHYALDDCKNQIGYCCAIWQKLNK